MATIEEFERAYRNVIVAAARLHVAAMFARFELGLIEDLVVSIDRGDIRLADVLAYVPGTSEVKSETTFRVEGKGEFHTRHPALGQR